MVASNVGVTKGKNIRIMQGRVVGELYGLLFKRVVQTAITIQNTPDLIGVEALIGLALQGLCCQRPIHSLPQMGVVDSYIDFVLRRTKPCCGGCGGCHEETEILTLADITIVRIVTPA
jgi:hypothetical protein